jgi:hypothetical protein
MTDSRPPRPPPSLADLHERALAETKDTAAAGAGRFMAWFDAHMPRSQPDGSPDERPAHDARPFADEGNRWPREVAARALPIALAVAAAAAVWFGARASAVWRPRALPTAASIAPDTPAALAPADPCLSAMRAGGDAPLIDDFEDGNELVALLEARNGYWVTLTDTDPERAEPVLVPTVRPGAVPGNRYAIHMAGGRHDVWGASVQVELGPTCYDASAYRGIAFDARGPGRLRAGVREVGAVPVGRGGTCTRDCYGSHVGVVVAGAGWTHHELTWDELHQEGATRPADPRRLNALEFLVRPDDTPYDLWIDNVAFVR